ncbi:MAG: tetratricopeptide repeat protein [Myxococcales bacterium]|nr:tetratricopeptide repeat protein [Myxococcales bacterium]
MSERDAGDDATLREASDEAGDDATGATHREGPGARRSGSRAPAVGDAADQEEPRLAPGTLIGRYVVVDVLGAGGMGVVYTAQDPELDRKVAIKLLQAQHGVGSESGGQSWLLREAQAMARLAHPNVVAVHDVGEMPGDRVFVAMELVEGMTLRAWLRSPRSWREVLHVMRAAGAGLAAAHAAGLVHRDFKPDNVLVGNDGRVRVMDFGLARLHSTDGDEAADRTSDLQIEAKSPLSERLTMTGAVLGTPAYMAPEIYRGQGADVLADQFAFGVALYEALYRARPFKRRDLVGGTATPPKPPANAKVPAWLEKIVLRTITLDPRRRFASMEEVLAALANDPTAGRRRLAIAGALVVVCGGAVVGAFALRGGDGVAAPEPCTDAATRLTGVWDPPAHTRLEAAFGKVGKPFVADTIRGTETTLDAYAASWVAMRTEACKATRVHGSQTEEVLTLRMACLDTRLVELEALVGLFVAADEPLVLGAVGAAQKLSSLTECADVPALLSPDPLPKDPAARAQVTSLQGKLAAARALYKASRIEDTLARTTAITADVTRLGHLPTEAGLHLMTGQALWVLKGPEAGEPELRKAVLAAEAGKADGIKVEALLQLTNLANGAGQFDVATDRLQQATAGLARLGTNWDLKVRVLASEALLALRQNQHAKAMEVAHRAVEVAEHHTESPSFSYALLVEATILNAASHSKEALVNFKKVLAYQDALGHRRIDVATTLQTMATAELSVGQVEDAITHLRSALEIEEAIYGPQSRDVASALNALSAAQVMKGDLEPALASAQRALAITTQLPGQNEELYASVLGQIADTLTNLKRPKEAIEHLDRAIEIQTKRLGAAHIQTLATMLTKCDAQRAALDLPGAERTCRGALAAAETAFGHDNVLLFLFLVHTGLVLQDAKQAREASTLYERALKLGANDESDVYYVQMLDARAHWDLGDHARAIELARKARDGFTALGEIKREQAHEAELWLARLAAR